MLALHAPRYMVKLVQREHKMVDRATEWQRRITTISVAAQFSWAAKPDSAKDEKCRVEEGKSARKQAKKQRKQAELRIKARWRAVVNLGSGAGSAADGADKDRGAGQAAESGAGAVAAAGSRQRCRGRQFYGGPG